jgi:hypothetical protein
MKSKKITLKHDGPRMCPWQVYTPAEPYTIRMYESGAEALQVLHRLAGGL